MLHDEVASVINAGARTYNAEARSRGTRHLSFCTASLIHEVLFAAILAKQFSLVSITYVRIARLILPVTALLQHMPYFCQYSSRG